MSYVILQFKRSWVTSAEIGNPGNCIVSLKKLKNRTTASCLVLQISIQPEQRTHTVQTEQCSVISCLKEGKKKTCNLIGVCGCGIFFCLHHHYSNAIEDSHAGVKKTSYGDCETNFFPTFYNSNLR